MHKRIIPLVMLAGLVFLAAAACGGDSEPTATPAARSSPPTIPQVPAATVATETGDQTGGQTDSQGGTPIDISLQDPGKSGEYKFSPSELTFSVGETVTFTLSSETEFHTFTVDDDRIDIDVDVDSGATETVSFTFDQAGTFKLICIPHSRLGMVGTITVR